MTFLKFIAYLKYFYVDVIVKSFKPCNQHRKKQQSEENKFHSTSDFIE